MSNGSRAEVVWDEHNVRHLLVDNARRGITVEDVEAVLLDPDTSVHMLTTGYQLSTGRGLNGRPLVVIAVGDHEIYPVTAYWVSERRWRNAHR